MAKNISINPIQHPAIGAILEIYWICPEEGPAKELDFLVTASGRKFVHIFSPERMKGHKLPRREWEALTAVKIKLGVNLHASMLQQITTKAVLWPQTNRHYLQQDYDAAVKVLEMIIAYQRGEGSYV